MDLLDCAVKVRISRSTGTVHTGDCSSSAIVAAQTTTMTLRELDERRKVCRKCTGYRRETILWERARAAADLTADVVVVCHGVRSIFPRNFAGKLATWMVTLPDPSRRDHQVVARVDPVTAMWLWLSADGGGGRFDGYGHLDSFGDWTRPWMAGTADQLPDGDHAAWPTVLALLDEDGYRDAPDRAVAAALQLTA